MKKYEVQLEMRDDLDDGRLKTVKIIVRAVNYTDAETRGHIYYDENLKGEHSELEIKKITLKKFDNVIDFGTMEDEECRLFENKVLIAHEQDPVKKVKRSILVRDYEISLNMENLVRELLTNYGAVSADVVSSKETDLSGISPIFEKLEEL